MAKKTYNPEFQTAPEHRGVWPNLYPMAEQRAAARVLAAKNSSDPFIFARAMTSMRVGINRPRDIIEGVSV